jgi:hypothetical protein
MFWIAISLWAVISLSVSCGILAVGLWQEKRRAFCYYLMYCADKFYCLHGQFVTRYGRKRGCVGLSHLPRHSFKDAAVRRHVLGRVRRRI